MKKILSIILLVVCMTFSNPAKSQIPMWYTLMDENFIGDTLHYKNIMYVHNAYFNHITQPAMFFYETGGFARIYEPLPDSFVFIKALLTIKIYMKPDTANKSGFGIARNGWVTYINKDSLDTGYYVKEFNNKSDSLMLIDLFGQTATYQIKLKYYGYFGIDTTTHDTTTHDTTHTGFSSVVYGNDPTYYYNHILYGNNVNVKIINMQGQTVFDEQVVGSRNIEHLGVGVYVMWVEENKNFRFRKILIQ